MSRTRTVAYLRVSTDKQADRGVSLDAQRAKVAAYAELYDLELVEVVVDAGERAKTLDRTGLARALGRLRKGGEAHPPGAQRARTGGARGAALRAREGGAPPGRRADRHSKRGGAARLERTGQREPVGARGHRRADRGSGAGQRRGG